MTAWACEECTTVYSVGAPRCPHCGSDIYTEAGMPKINSGGPSFDGDLPGEDGTPSAGTSSSASETKPGQSSTTTPPSPRRRARTTESPSGQDPEPTPEQESASTAPSTDGSTPGTGSGQSPSDITGSGGITLPPVGAEGE